MNLNERYSSAKELYAALGVDTEAALEQLNHIPVSMHCWQGDDVHGFEGAGPLSGGIQTTGDYPGCARTPKELMSDLEAAYRLIPGRHRLSLHASYAIFAPGEAVDRDRLEPHHFAKWVEFAKANGLALDFNPTLFSHPKAAKATLTSTDKDIRRFWIDHCKACIRISEYFAEELGSPCLMNIWIPDGLKDVPADRMGPRARFKESLDDILGIEYDHSKVLVSLESKVFGIGLESYTAGSSEFCLGYAAKSGILPLMDNGHYHPTEVVSDKISSLLLFFEEIALHITRSVRWDSDHVVRFDDETREITKEIVRNGALDRVKMGLDFFDASINRVAAWVIGMRSFQKALLDALLCPHEKLKALQDAEDFTSLMALQEELKTYPLGDVWNEFCRRNGVPGKEDWVADMKEYEANILRERV